MENLKSHKSDWLDFAEIGSVVLAGAGTLFAGLSQPFMFACLPIPAALALNLVNRKRLLANLENLTQTNIESIHLSQKNIENNEQAIRSLLENKVDNDSNFAELFRQSKLAEQHLIDLDEKHKNLESELNNLQKEEDKLENVVENLRSIENMSQAISGNPTAANFYYQRALSRQSLGDKQGAVIDYTLAIQYNSNLAQAHYNRGVLNAELSNRKAAVEDLRKAAKLYFEQEDLTNYQNAKDLMNQYHSLNEANHENKSNSILIGNLFS